MTFKYCRFFGFHKIQVVLNINTIYYKGLVFKKIKKDNGNESTGNWHIAFKIKTEKCVIKKFGI